MYLGESLNMTDFKLIHVSPHSTFLKDVDPLNISPMSTTCVTLLLDRSWLKYLKSLNMLRTHMNLPTFHLDRFPLNALTWLHMKIMLVTCVTSYSPIGRYGPWSNRPLPTVCMRRQRLRDHLCAVVENCSVARNIPGLQWTQEIPQTCPLCVHLNWPTHHRIVLA